MMRIPFAITFDEFKEKYNNKHYNYTEWKKVYNDGDELDFLKAIEDRYNLMPTHEYLELYFRKRKIKISISKYFNIIKKRVDEHIKLKGLTIEHSSQYKNLIPYVFDNSMYFDGYFLDFNTFYFLYKPFLYIDIDITMDEVADYMETNKGKFNDNDIINFEEIGKGKYEIKFAERLFKNFQFAKKRIFEFIEQRREEIKQEKLKTQEVKTLPPTTQEVTPTPIETQEIEHLSEKQINVIGLMKLAGFDKFLREKNPDITDSQIAKFYVKINSCDKMNNHESIRPHLTTDLNNKHHPFYKTGKKETYETILRQYGISPQANE